MRFLELKLDNYIGIYNGMGLNTIHIDLSKCVNRTLIIRGENGSGKSTIFKALSVMPDPNESFIPGLEASKLISLSDNNIIYTIRFIHGVKSNGDRETTKAFISKTVDGMAIEMNKNGNVTSFKEILYWELGLDSNFIALSQLSSEDKGIASKRPADRKKFVGSIIESLEVYNNIYKIVSKKSNALRSMMDSILVKMGKLGTDDELDEALAAADAELVELKQQLQIQIEAKISGETRVQMLDKDNSIAKYNKASEDLKKANKEFMPLIREIDYPVIFGPHAALECTIVEEIDYINADTNNFKVELSKLQQSRLMTKESLDRERYDIQSIVANINLQLDMDSYNETRALLERYTKSVNDTNATLNAIGIDARRFTVDEYILALETVHDIDLSVNLFRSKFDNHVIGDAVALYETHNWTPMVPMKDPTPFQDAIDLYISKQDYYTKAIYECEMEMDTIQTLSNRPDSCKDDTCFFVANMVKIAKTNPSDRYKKLSKEFRDLKDDHDRSIMAIEDIRIFNDCVSHIQHIIRDIDKNKSILTRLPNGGIFASKAEFFTKLLSGESIDFVTRIYEYIDMANLVDIFHRDRELMETYNKKMEVFEYALTVVEDLNKDLAVSKRFEAEYIDKLGKLDLAIMDVSNRIAERDTRYQYLTSTIIPRLTRAVDLVNMIESSENMMNAINQSITDINDSMAIVSVADREIEYLNNKIRMKENERGGLEFSRKQLTEYQREIEVYNVDYRNLEALKYFSSPTKGIQLVFMELYMGKILNLANELLARLFNGNYVIQPFIINESEFRIPCLGEGYINEDISSMSNSQLTMISMIISFALLHTSSTKFNIIKMDEIDAPLDESNRILFIDVMNHIMDIMNVEQAVMISHNSELQSEMSDVILLKSRELSSDYTRGNIVWKY